MGGPTSLKNGCWDWTESRGDSPAPNRVRWDHGCPDRPPDRAFAGRSDLDPDDRRYRDCGLGDDRQEAVRRARVHGEGRRPSGCSIARAVRFGSGLTHYLRFACSFPVGRMSCSISAPEARRFRVRVHRPGQLSPASAVLGEALIFRPNEGLAVDPFEPANREMTARHLLEMLDERIVQWACPPRWRGARQGSDARGIERLFAGRPSLRGSYRSRQA